MVEGLEFRVWGLYGDLAKEGEYCVGSRVKGAGFEV